MISAAIFDLDGLMFDTEPIWDQAWSPALEKYGLKLTYKMACDGRGKASDSLCQALRDNYGQQIDAEGICAELDAQALKLFEKGVDKKPGIDSILSWLEEAGIPCAVASSSSYDMIYMHLRSGGLEKYFTKVVSGKYVAHAKPAPDVFLKAADLMGVPVSECVVFEDSNAGAQAGITGGFKTIVIPDRVEPADEICAGAFKVCKDLHEALDVVKQL